ncbi:MAG: CBS domain-containing protein [Pseudomonadota bacterium]|nr:CBS domain-containing protein [Pseudomonadota bacterium]
MKVGDIMTRTVEAVSPDATIQEAATLMAEHDIGAVLVSAEGAPEGILTDRDIILRVVVDGRDPAQVRVREVMSKRLFTCRADDTVDGALRMMRDHQVRRLPVVDDDGQLLGIVALSDLAKAEPLPEPEKVVEALREVAEPHRQAASA